MRRSPEAEAFIREILAVCRKHDMGLAHQDTEGAFVIQRPLLQATVDWLNDAEEERSEDGDD
jgi:hypothetical protein